MKNVPFLLLVITCGIAARLGLALGLVALAGFGLGLFEPLSLGAAALRRALPSPGLRRATAFLTFFVLTAGFWGLLQLSGPSPQGDVASRFVVGTYAFIMAGLLRLTSRLRRDDGSGVTNT